MRCRNLIAVLVGISVNFFSFQAFPEETVEQTLSLPNKGSSMWISGHVFNSLAAQECASTPNMPSLAPQLDNQEAFEVFPIYYDWLAEKDLWERGYRSCAVIKTWPLKIKNAIKSIISNNNFLLDPDAEAHFENWHSPKWLRAGGTLPAEMLFLGIEIKYPGESLGEFRRICHAINLDKTKDTEWFIQYYKDNNIIDENGSPKGWKCSNSEAALIADANTKEIWGVMNDLYDEEGVAQAEVILAGLKDYLKELDVVLEQEAKFSVYNKWSSENSLCPASFKMYWSDASSDVEATSQNPYVHQLLKNLFLEYPEELSEILDKSTNDCNDEDSLTEVISTVEWYSKEQFHKLCPDVLAITTDLPNPMDHVIHFDAPIFEMLKNSVPDWVDVPNKSACRSEGSFQDAGKTFASIDEYRGYLATLANKIHALLLDQGVSHADLHQYYSR